MEPLKFGNGQVISFTLYWVYDYLSMPGSKLNHVSKKDPSNELQQTLKNYFLESANY